MTSLRIIRARAAEADTLTAIAFAAKRHWGYPEAWIHRWENVLTISPEYVDAHATFAAVERGAIVGFHAVQFQGPDAALDHLWVLPAAMRRGIGRSLFGHAEFLARDAGALRLTITGDPHAIGFYERMGASVCGHEPAPMEGRMRYLPLLEKRLASAAHPLSGDSSRSEAV